MMQNSYVNIQRLPQPLVQLPPVKKKNNGIVHFIDGQKIYEIDRTTKRTATPAKVPIPAVVSASNPIQNSVSVPVSAPLAIPVSNAERIPTSVPMLTPGPMLALTPIVSAPAPAPCPPAPPTYTRNEIMTWTVDRVCQFLSEHENIRQVASQFKQHQIDGEALILIADQNSEARQHTLEKIISAQGLVLKVDKVLSKYKLTEK